MEKKTIVCCLPGLAFSNVWVSNWTSLLVYLMGKFNVHVLFGFSNNIYITRNTLLDGLFRTCKVGGFEFDYVLWMDDDNPLSTDGLEILVADLEGHSELAGVMGWYWLQPHGYQMEPMVSCGLLTTNEVRPMKPEEMFKGNELVKVEYGGMGALLVRWSELKKLGDKSFNPVLLEGGVGMGFAGDDVSLFFRAKAAGMQFAVDKRVKVPHLKLREADFDSAIFVSLPVEIRPAEDIQGWMSRQELTWLYEQAGRMESVIEIGSWRGRSAYALLSGCKGEVCCVDTWAGCIDTYVGTSYSLADEAKDHDIFAEFKKNVGHFPNLRTCKGSSVEASKKFFGSSVDMVFIDAGHTFEEVVADLNAWKEKAGKLLCGHDADREEVKRALAAVGIPWKKGPGCIWYVDVEAKVGERAA